MKRIAIIGASYLQLPLIKKAKEMGLETHVFAWETNDVGEAEADFFYPISIVEKQKILSICKDLKIDGIVSIASDLATITVNYVAANMCLTGNSPESVLMTTNKYEMRKALNRSGVITPKFCVTSGDDICVNEFAFPIIVKPTDRSGSRAVTKVYQKEEVREAVNRAISESFEKRAIIEEFLYGKEYSVEGISFRGKHTILAFTEKFTTGEPNYIETGHLEPALLSDSIKERISEIIQVALDALGVENGASHSEIKIDEDGKVQIIEIGARMGGDLIGSDLVYYSTGIDYVRAVIQIALGEEPDLSSNGRKHKVKVQYLLSEKDLKEYESYLKEMPEKILYSINIQPERISDFSNSSERNGGVYLIEL